MKKNAKNHYQVEENSPMQEQTDDNAGADLAPAIQISEATVVTRLEKSHKIATRKANVGGKPRGTRTPEGKARPVEEKQPEKARSPHPKYQGKCRPGTHQHKPGRQWEPKRTLRLEK